MENLKVLVPFSHGPQNNINRGAVSERCFRFYAQAGPFKK